jgi:hypothetical protein
MNAAPSLSKDALRLYALTIAYLHNAEMGNEGSTSAIEIREISPTLFHIWQGEYPAAPKQAMVPTAICTYNQTAQTWKVELHSGESLTLLDNQNVWELVGETKKKTKKSPAGKGAKTQRLLPKKAS